MSKPQSQIQVLYHWAGKDYKAILFDVTSLAYLDSKGDVIGVNLTSEGTGEGQYTFA